MVPSPQTATPQQCPSSFLRPRHLMMWPHPELPRAPVSSNSAHSHDPRARWTPVLFLTLEAPSYLFSVAQTLKDPALGSWIILRETQDAITVRKKRTQIRAIAKHICFRSRQVRAMCAPPSNACVSANKTLSLTQPQCAHWGMGIYKVVQGGIRNAHGSLPFLCMLTSYPSFQALRQLLLEPVPIPSQTLSAFPCSSH